jgi:hypothetical protein
MNKASVCKMTIVVAFLLFCMGCATVDSLQRGAGGETFLVQNKSYDEIWRAAILAVGKQLTIVESDKSSGTIKAERAISVATWGELVGVFITPEGGDPHTFQVEVESLRRDQVQITGQDWTLTIVEGIKAELGS